MYKQIDHGFKPSVIDENEHYVLGDGWLAATMSMPTGHGWDKWLPKSELQSKNGLETMNCTNYAILNCVETLGRMKYGASFQNDLSERYLGILSGTTEGGNDPHHVCEILRSPAGAIPEAFLPFDQNVRTWNQYYSPKPISYSLFKIGYSWSRKYKYGHDWVLGSIPDELRANIKTALKYSPVSIAGFAWSKHADDLYYPDGPVCHYFVIYDYVDGVKWLVLDTYDNTFKELAWNYVFVQAKRHSLTKNIGAMGGDVEVGTWETVKEYIKYRFRNLFS